MIGFQSILQSTFLALQASHLSLPCKTSHCFEGPSSSAESLLSSTPIRSASSSLFSTYSAFFAVLCPACHQLPVLPDSLDNYLLPPPFSAAQVAASALSLVAGSP